MKLVDAGTGAIRTMNEQRQVPRRESRYVLFFSHAPQMKWLGILARIFRDSFNLKSAILVMSDIDEACAKEVNAFDKVVNVGKAQEGIDTITSFKEAAAVLAVAEDRVEANFINEAMAMDRHESKRSRGYQAVVIDLANIAVKINRLIEKDGPPAMLICEPNLTYYRLAHRLLSPVPSLYIYALTKVSNRVYFDYSLGYDWERVKLVYDKFVADGIPNEEYLQAAAIYKQLMADQNLAADTQQFIAQGGNNYVILRRIAGAFSFSNVRKIIKMRHWSDLPVFAAKKIADQISLLIGGYGVYFYRKFGLKKLSVSAIPAGEKYSTYFMHQQPEHSTEGVAFEYRNQIDTAVTIAASLPVGMWLAVKEHPSMIGLRPISDYKKLLKQKNIKLLAPDAHSHHVIKHASIVFTLSGTVSIESVLYGVPVITLGRIYYNYFNGVHHLERWRDLPRLVRHILDESAVKKNDSAEKSIMAIAAILGASYPGKFSSYFSLEEMASAENVECLRNALRNEMQAMGVAIAS